MNFPSKQNFPQKNNFHQPKKHTQHFPERKNYSFENFQK